MDYVQNFTEDFGNALTRRVQRTYDKGLSQYPAGKILEVLKTKEKATVFARAAVFISWYGCLSSAPLGAWRWKRFSAGLPMGEWMSRSSFVWGLSVLSGALDAVS